MAAVKMAMNAATWLAAACLPACLRIGVQVPEAPAQEFRVVAYVAGWSMPEAVPAEKLTHVNFAFARIDADGRVAFENPRYAEAIASLVALKARNPRLKVLVSVGGWEADGFSDAALTPDSRARFAASAVDFVRRHRLDGIDLDWEYPGQGVAGIKFRAEDKENFTLLLRDLRAALDAASRAEGRDAGRYLLTIASADREYFDHAQMDRLHVYLDWVNVMAYDFFNRLTPTTGHHAGLHASAFAAPEDRNASASIAQHLAAGIPPEKLVLGVAFYGRRFEGVDPLHEGLNRPYERYGGEHAYATLAESYIGREGYVRRWDVRARAPFLWNAAARSFITYDDPQSIREKTAFACGKRLGGVMFWELSQDREGELLDAIRGAAQEAGRGCRLRAAPAD
jgi:chitinase